jgi:NAD(P)-dependent dehydrogenase (short-subunit alcohol dehydrogenase family)
VSPELTIPDLLARNRVEDGARPVLVDDDRSITHAEIDDVSREVAARLVALDRPGAIVNYTSQGWMSGGCGGSVVYNAAKGGVTTLTRGLARTWARHRIRVNAVAPGLVETPMLVDASTTPEQLAALTASIPMGRLGQPEDHVGATLYLASDLAAYVTGATLNVSGGFLMY